MSHLLKVLSYWNLNTAFNAMKLQLKFLKVLSYWNLNVWKGGGTVRVTILKVLSYWNLNTDVAKESNWYIRT